MNVPASSVEQRLRNMMRDERLALPAWPDPLERVWATRVRRQRVRRLLGLLGAALAAILVALTLRWVVLVPAGSDGSPAPTLLPWVDLPAPLPGATAYPPASASQPRYSGLTVRIEAPATARRGQLLPYAVVLANPTRVTIDLDPCPVYAQVLDKNGGFYRLNCAQPRLAPGGQLRYEMLLAVHPQTTLGPAALNWTLYDANETSAQARATVQVTD